MFISENDKSKLIQLSDDKYPIVKVIFGGKDSNREPEIIDCDEFIALKSYKARGKRISNYNIKKFEWLEPRTVTDSDKEDTEQETEQEVNKPEENNIKDSLDKKNNNQQNKKNDTNDSSAEQISLDF